MFLWFRKRLCCGCCVRYTFIDVRQHSRPGIILTDASFRQWLPFRKTTSGRSCSSTQGPLVRNVRHDNGIVVVDSRAPSRHVVLAGRTCPVIGRRRYCTAVDSRRRRKTWKFPHLEHCLQQQRRWHVSDKSVSGTAVGSDVSVVCHLLLCCITLNWRFELWSFIIRLTTFYTPSDFRIQQTAKILYSTWIQLRSFFW